MAANPVEQRITSGKVPVPGCSILRLKISTGCLAAGY